MFKSRCKTGEGVEATTYIFARQQGYRVHLYQRGNRSNRGFDIIGLRSM